MECPKCGSRNRMFEIASGYRGHRCGNCNHWYYKVFKTKRKSGTENKFKKRFEKALPEMREAAKHLGYAITTHGSMERDFDIMVIPWADNYKSSNDVADAIRKTANGKWRCEHQNGQSKNNREWWPFDWEDSSNENKDYVDMSVIVFGQK